MLLSNWKVFVTTRTFLKDDEIIETKIDTKSKLNIFPHSNIEKLSKIKISEKKKIKIKDLKLTLKGFDIAEAKVPQELEDDIASDIIIFELPNNNNVI